MDDNVFRNWLNEKVADECVRNLKKHGFDARFFQTSPEARQSVLDMVSGFESFGFGGSSTTRGLGLPEELRNRGKTVFDHWQNDLTKEQDSEIRLRQGRCDCFFCSANAIAATGEIINVDGVGNRNNAMTFGPKKVVIVAGMNKVRPDTESALRRIKEIAAPMRAKSLNMRTPCAQTGICADCDSPQRICRITTILHRKPMLTDISVVLINEVLGF